MILREELALDRERHAAVERAERIATRTRTSRAYRGSGTRRIVYTAQA